MSCWAAAAAAAWQLEDQRKALQEQLSRARQLEELNRMPEKEGKGTKMRSMADVRTRVFGFLTSGS